jgi:2-iminobutanoate/2-iminopropanoate deaminase
LISEDVGEQARQTLVNIGQVLEAGNSSYANIIKSTVYLVDMNDFAKVNEEYARFFKSDFPARSCFAVKQLPKNGTFIWFIAALVEIEVIAVQNDPATAP